MSSHPQTVPIASAWPSMVMPRRLAWLSKSRTPVIIFISRRALVT
jgi:hypothetical protein